MFVIIFKMSDVNMSMGRFWYNLDHEMPLSKKDVVYDDQ